MTPSTLNAVGRILCGPQRSIASISAIFLRSILQRMKPNGAARSTATNGFESLEKYAYPILGDLTVAAITRAHVLEVLQPIWTTKTVTAERLQKRIAAILDAAEFGWAA